MAIEQNLTAKAQKWLSSNIDEASRSEIRAMLEDEEALTEAFYKDLEFGTGGLRGLMGIGSNRMNKYTLGMATQGLANYLIKTYPRESIKVAIAHDSRNNSDIFARAVADVFTANGIMTYLFESLRPTPELSFAIRHLQCHSGVVLTASHNPKEYNGYKAYWNDGGQLVAPHDINVIKEVQSIESINEVKFEGNDAILKTIGKDIDEAYLNEVTNLSLSPEAVAQHQDLKIVFSPIHGTGGTLVPECLKRFGFSNVTLVEEQVEPNGNFPTVEYPNPEEAEAMKLSLQKAEEIDADLVMATDPDADRVGIAVKNTEGKFQLLNGNQTGSLLVYYVLKRWKELNKYKGNEFTVKTIVTSDLIQEISDHFGVECFNTLTGFKFIASLIKSLEGNREFIVGGEESYGYMVGDFVRDKDAVASCAMIAEMTAYAKSQGQSLFEMLIDIYAEFGFYKEKLISITKKGKKGADEIAAMMSDFRSNPPKELGGSKVSTIIDYKSSESRDLKSGDVAKIDFPSSNVLQFLTANGDKISARPSGTEPKIKFYISIKESLSNKEEYHHVDETLDKKITQIIEELKVN